IFREFIMTSSPVIFYCVAFLAITGYAVLPVMAKFMQASIPSFGFIAITMVFLSLMAAATSYFFEKDFSLSAIPASSWVWLIGFSLVNCAAFALMLLSIKHIPVAEYQLIQLATPLIGGLLAYILLKEGFNPKILIGMAFTGIGLYIALKK